MRTETMSSVKTSDIFGEGPAISDYTDYTYVYYSTDKTADR